MNLFWVRFSLGCVFSAAVLSGQSLNAVLGELKSPQVDRVAVSRELTSSLLALANRNHRPSREMVAAFSDELTKGLAGRPLTDLQIRLLSGAIPPILSPTGTTSSKGATLLHFLGFARVPEVRSDKIVTRFIRIGEEVRGPEDMLIRRELPLPRK